MPKKADVTELLLKEGLITQDMLNRAVEETKRTGLNIEKALAKLGYINEEDITKARATALSFPYMDLTDYLIDIALIKLIPENVAKKHKVIPLFKVGSSLTVAMVDPQDIVAIDQLRQVSQIYTIYPVLVSEKGIQRILDSYYGAAGSIEDIIKSIEREKLSEGQNKNLAEAAEEAPIIKLVNLLIMQAVQDRASDIHIEPEDEKVRVRFRIDGILHESFLLPKKLQSVVTSRIKILANMDIAESRKPQDGRMRMKMENKDLDVRVSVFPMVHGENIVMRLLDKTSVLIGLKELGFSNQDFENFNKLIHRPNGIILVTGPTGSGKTTTLYSALTTISSMELNILTIEDPVEYEIPLIRQTQVNPKAGITFANGLRSILRQDPDVIMVGEIRDKETADIAVQAALTGHLVLATLHTNDAASAVTRLVDMGIEPFLVSSSLIGIIAQRLVRLICDKCKEKYTPEAEVLKDLGLGAGVEFYRGRGCDKCKKSGFMGRTSIFELFIVNEEIRKLIDTRASSDEIKKKAIESGMSVLREDGLGKVQKGLVTPEEVLRVTELEA